MSYAIGVDLGGTHLRAVRLDQEGHIHAHQRVATASTAGPTAVITQIEQLITQVIGDRDRSEILGVGVASPGPVDLQAGVARQAPTIQGWYDVPLRAILSERTGLPVELNNDGHVATLGEWRFGSGQGCEHFVYVTISTGIGGGVISDGRLVLGRQGMAAELGHMTLQPDGPLCCCGNHGCWEALASGSALAQFARQALARGARSTIAAIAAGALVSGAHVAEAAAQSDELALRLLRDEGEWIGIGLVNLLHLYAPDRIALGGGVMASMPLLEAHIRRVIAQRAMPPFRDIPFQLAELGDNAGVIGAATLVL
jgi:glucokinase